MLSITKVGAFVSRELSGKHLKCTDYNISPNNIKSCQGHAAPGLYSAWCAAGLFPKEELLKLRQFGNDLEGHPTPRLNFIDAATGSLGQGLSVAAGMAYIGKYMDHAR